MQNKLELAAEITIDLQAILHEYKDLPWPIIYDLTEVLDKLEAVKHGIK